MLPVDTSGPTSPPASSITSGIDKYLSDVRAKLDGYCETMQSNQNKFDGMVKMLSDLVVSNNGNTNESSPPSTNTAPMAPNTASPNLIDSAICDPYVKYTKDIVGESLQNSLQTFITQNEAKFKTIGNRDTLYYGEYKYRYSGAEHKAQAMPPPLTELVQAIKPHMSDPNSVLNTCLITRYKDGSNFIPPHRDNSPDHNPESEFVTVSLGGTEQ